MNVNQSETEPIQLPAAVVEKRRLPIVALFIANVCSYIGDVLMMLAIPWLVLQTTGSAAQAGITAFSSMLSVVISSFFGSLLIDRLGYKRTSVCADIASGIAVVLIPLCYMTIGLSFWELQALVFLAGLLQTPGSQARYALLPDLITLSRMPAERANSLYDGVRRVAGFFGAPLAGVLIIAIGTANLLWVDGATFFFSAILLAWAVPHTPPVRKADEKKGGRESYIEELKEGLIFVRRTPVMLTIVIVVMITNLLDQGISGVIQPVYVRQIFGNPLALGELVAAFGGAAFLGTMLFAWIGHRLPRRRTLGLSFTLSTVLRFLPLALALPLPLLIAAYIVAGLLIGPVNPIFSSVEQELVPVEMRARVFGALSAGVSCGMPLGGLIAGFFVQWTGVIPAIIAFGIIYLACTISLLVNPALKAIDKPPETHETSPQRGNPM
ncbi:MFS transporter [Dictyobacter aurantiacus]|uniref:Multidrug efflux pump Tap n=1 Tax=Dictyobacter aurantiacus TaxID=1936993 RepID=A0A401ZJU5_9CHLR|nr:MFS transporter [Dictyobacter aurantiacus]GCE07135.1 putative drug antiporter protein precursor [Dictyobacter aurantiacus]